MLLSASGLVLALLAVGSGSSTKPSTCFGTVAAGALTDAWKLPRNGPNFRAYSDVGWLTGRTFVHDVVYSIVLEAYASLAGSQPEHEFIYGETGFAKGGRFKPHRTHQNGLSVDFMVPVRDAHGVARQIPTGPADKLGYGLEFDETGRLDDLRIDFEAVAEHLAALDRAAKSHGATLRKVIFAPELRARLVQTRAWPRIARLPFTTHQVWIRHDEHYHVDFGVPCKPPSG